jgi:hypothetical protein
MRLFHVVIPWRFQNHNYTRPHSITLMFIQTLSCPHTRTVLRIFPFIFLAYLVNGNMKYFSSMRSASEAVVLNMSRSCHCWIFSDSNVSANWRRFVFFLIHHGFLNGAKIIFKVHGVY